MRSVTAFAPAKINLALHVGAPRADGRHPIASLAVFANVGDRVTVREGAGALVLSGPFAAALAGEPENLVQRALVQSQGEELVLDDFCLTLSPPTAPASEVAPTPTPEPLPGGVREEVRRIDPQLPLTFETMGRIFDRTIATRRYNLFLLGTFAATALTLALIGVYGVMSYTVAQNRREIGIRLALGAEARHILRIVVGQGAFLAGLGITIGMLSTAGLTRLMTALLFEVGALDPLSFSVVPVLIASGL